MVLLKTPIGPVCCLFAIQFSRIVTHEWARGKATAKLLIYPRARKMSIKNQLTTKVFQSA